MNEPSAHSKEPRAQSCVGVGIQHEGAQHKHLAPADVATARELQLLHLQPQAPLLLAGAAAMGG